MVISSAPVPPYKNTSGVTLQTESGPSVNSTWLQSCCSQSRCSAAHLLRARHVVAWGQRNADIAYVHRALPHEADYVLFG
ncbi:hypothetical protein TNCV_753681 [Trichonephila clavipes]|nr:hypothetical protein TNCV_753681 [Trichonephila clavipes]